MKRVSEAAIRNTPAIAEELKWVLPKDGLVLEVGSGTGQHAAAFSALFPNLNWQPTNHDDVDSVQAWREESAQANFLEPVLFDLFDAVAPVEHADAIYCANVLHIAPAPAVKHLFRHAAILLPSDAPLVLYGPYRYRERPLEPSNEDFDMWLRSNVPGGGIRVLEDVVDIANSVGIALRHDISMPANNRLLVFKR